MAHILIIGATSGIGLETVRLALKAGHTVTAFARTADTLAVEVDGFDAGNLHRIAGDAYDAQAVSDAVKNADVIVHTLGLALTPASVFLPTDIFSKTTRILVDAMSKTGKRRLIAVTGIAAGNARDHLGPLYGLAFNAVLKKMYDDKDVQEQIIKASELDWTIARPGILTNGPASESYQVLTEPSSWKVGNISRKDVALFIVTESETAKYVRQTPVLIEDLARR